MDAGRLTLRSHRLRHTCVALLIANDAQRYEVMERLDHTSIQTTINTYGQLFPCVRDRIRPVLEETRRSGVVTDLEPTGAAVHLALARRHSRCCGTLPHLRKLGVR